MSKTPDRDRALADLGLAPNGDAGLRNTKQLGDLRDELGDSLATVTADVADPVVAGSLIEQYRPKTLVLNAGAAPLMRPIQHHTWDTFSHDGEVDVRHAFHGSARRCSYPSPRRAPSSRRPAAPRSSAHR
jgi:hypothetical protein